MSSHDPDKSNLSPGVAEEAARFDAASDDRLAVARARLEEHERTQAGTMSVEEFGQKLRAEITRKRVAKG